jgi:hypothetical protein
MAHPIEEVIRRAAAERWCCDPHCTTCGCMPFRTAIRDLPADVVTEFLSRPKDIDLKRLPNYARLLHLILFHGLPRTEEERLEAAAQSARASEAMDRKHAEARAAARERKLVRLAEKRTLAAKMHSQRQVESTRRRQFRDEIAAMSLAGRITVMLANPHISPAFFQVRPEEIDAPRIAAMEPALRSTLAARISNMRNSHWRGLRTLLLRTF